jgi:CubicO group peptidase (beta-lactamase class C family)
VIPGVAIFVAALAAAPTASRAEPRPDAAEGVPHGEVAAWPGFDRILLVVALLQLEERGILELDAVLGGGPFDRAVAARVLEAHSGRTVRQYLQENVFAPLAMGSASVADDGTVRGSAVDRRRLVDFLLAGTGATSRAEEAVLGADARRRLRAPLWDRHGRALSWGLAFEVRRRRNGFEVRVPGEPGWVTTAP